MVGKLTKEQREEILAWAHLIDNGLDPSRAMSLADFLRWQTTVAAALRAYATRDLALEKLLEIAAGLARQERHNREGSESAFERGAVAASCNIEDAITALAKATTP